MNDDRWAALEAMSAHTRDRCGTREKCGFRGPRRCCDELYCDIAQGWSLSIGEDVSSLRNGSTIPFMGENGCVLKPHQRPLCTVHDCQIEKWACDPDDEEWTRIYFELRERVATAVSRSGDGT